MLLIHLVVLTVRRLDADYLALHRSLGMILEAFPVLWLALPLLVGSVAIAEERKLGTFETVSSIPISRWWQFSIKLGLVVVLGILLGAVVPLAIEQLGKLAGLTTNTMLAFDTEVLPIVSISLLTAAGIALLAFYGSSLTRNTLQSLGSAVLACIIALLLIEVAAHPPNPGDIPLWGVRLLTWILCPTMVLTLLVLARRNYRHLQFSAALWWRNGLVLLILIVSGTTLTSAIYHRFWEAWLPLEPPHRFWAPYGTHRQSVSAKVQASSNRMAALLSDGRLWLRQRAFGWMRVGQGQSAFLVPQAEGSVHGGFVPGANWMDIAVSELGGLAIQADGSLWDLSGIQPGTRNAEANLKRIGNGRNWVKISAGWRYYCGLKADGTLWEWRPRNAPAGRMALKEGLGLPVQIGVDTDWVAVAVHNESSLAVKADGTVWRWGWILVARSNNGSVTSKTLTQPERWLAFPEPIRPVSLSFDGSAVAAVCADGSLWVGGHLPIYRMLSLDLLQRAKTEMVRWGNESNWERIEWLESMTAVAIKRGGSMWTWDKREIYWVRDDSPAPLVPVSRYPVWTSVCSYHRAFLALGSDDTLCLWGDPAASPYHFLDRPDPGALLLPSRIRARVIADLAP